jgi:hypothetical protein
VRQKKTCVVIMVLSVEQRTFLVVHRDFLIILYILVFMLSTRYSCQILKKLEFSREIFEDNSFSVSQVVPFGWTEDRGTVRQT